LLYIDFVKAEIPARTRDGREWDSLGGSPADPFAKLIVNDREIIKTPIQSNTLAPTWPDQKRANYRISTDATVRVEIWDSNTLNNHRFASRSFANLTSRRDDTHDVDCSSGAQRSHPCGTCPWALG